MPYKDPEVKRAKSVIYQRRHRERKGSEAVRAEERARYKKNQKTIVVRKREWRASNRHKDAAYRTKTRSTVYGRAVMLHDNARSRARKKNMSFSLTLEHVLAGIETVFCPKTGVMFDLSKTGGRTNPYAPSVDRIDANKPYSDDNVQVVAWFYNHMKHCHSEVVLLDLCARILEHAK